MTATVKEEKIPLWLKDFYRADVIAFGSFPFTFFLSTTIMDLIRSSQHGWDLRYAPWPVKSAGAIAMTEDEQLTAIGAAAGGAILVALTDFIITQIKRSREEAARKAPGEPVIIREPWPRLEDETPADDSGEVP